MSAGAIRAGKAYYELVTKDTGLKAGLASARKQLAGFGSSLAATMGRVTAIAAPLAAALAGGGIVMLVKQQMEAIDATAKLSDRLGISTEALVGFQHAANLAGSSAEQVGAAIGKMLVNISKASGENNTTTQLLDSVGISAAKLQAMAPEDAFLSIADSLKAIHNPALRAEAAVAIFGKSGQDLLPMMLDGSAGIRAMMEEAKRLGLTFDREAAAKVELANDAMTRLQGVVIGLARTLAIELAPFIQATAEYFTAMGTEGEGMGAKVTNAFESVLMGVASAADWLELLKAGFYSLKATVAGSIANINRMLDAMIGAIARVLKLIPGMGEAVEQYMAFREGMIEGLEDIATESAGKMADAWGKFQTGANAKAVAASFDAIRAKAAAAAKELADSRKQLNGIGGDFEDAGDKAKDAAQKIADAAKNIAKELRQINMPDVEKKLDDLKAMGADAITLFQAEGQLTLIEQAKRAAEIKRENASPAERLAQSQAELEGLRERLGEDFFKRAMEGALKDFRESMPKDTTVGSFRSIETAGPRGLDRITRATEETAKHTRTIANRKPEPVVAF